MIAQKYFQILDIIYVTIFFVPTKQPIKGRLERRTVSFFSINRLQLFVKRRHNNIINCYIYQSSMNKIAL